MKFSENWLRNHVPIQANRDVLVATLTAIGLEVENVAVLGEALDLIVVARIVNVVPHPESDLLQICQVDVAQDNLLQIVCGASNVRPGLVVPLALLGAKIGALTIKSTTLRGVESNGMLCSAKELGLDTEASGLMELPEDAPIGTPLADYLALPDASIEIKLTPNRADCFSVRGIAFDVAAACASEVTPFHIDEIPAVSARTLPVELHAGANAPRYCGCVIEGIDSAAPTPVWMAERLRRSGIRPVSLLVDITQYVMLELGQPMHAFDVDTLRGPIGVRLSRNDEALKLLDGRTVVLDNDFLVVTDADQPIALAGLIGGWETRITDTTVNVFLEAAHFAPAAIMGRGRKLGLHTDASHRFERGVDPALPPQAIAFATRLILELAGGKPGSLIHVELPEYLPAPASILLRRTRIARLLGIVIDDAEVERILQALGMQVTTQAEGWRVVAPSRRFDIAIEEDLIEELVRIRGYEHLPTALPVGASHIAMPSETRLDMTSVRRQLIARELQETINYAFIDAELLRRWQLNTGQVMLMNPLSAELAVMRPRLLPGLVAALGRNIARQLERVRLFELGNVFTASDEAGVAPLETRHVAAAVCGDAFALQWGEQVRKVDFYDLKGDLESLAAASGAVLTFHSSAQPWGHPGRSADVWCDDMCIGWIGQLHPALTQTLEINVDVIAFELALEPLVRRALPRAHALSRFPFVRRDLACVVPEHVTWSELAITVRDVIGPLLRDVKLFDRYVGKGIEPGFKSLAIGLILQDDTRTLIDRDVDDIMTKVVMAIQQRHDVRIRS
ncbi:phenylalanine--tRNA ligase subunit beta [Xylella fastidiosa]|uniref:phenylalanine--tRNA ligase subunit beta n=1 Tax=Xylella fastidiosa TaxID=2371 RepID=UPI0004DCF9E7|nr:phenylalanine--tRNA ligase subunit beta [Xylella fastidiosa]KFA40547.1 phenylalanyl-tRNA synthetase subunit beta [Xylella fastidiosa]MDD0908426.1 phenylalanine--tRNA ligase subunit beta [Xylella fastidiosa subsp. multiplex]MDD0928663.1 phenylalanine--tRNA ligase subunit beta [Xylella fastidiosa subsp. multiplex]MDS9988866.1 phenylalanine--tRNA ligase subunit beta [Xylella fastidiosa]QTX27798.1 phenylalanine--tRNA ligase subunit beta [Xylella fastidiosa subsp. multiplex]